MSCVFTDGFFTTYIAHIYHYCAKIIEMKDILKQNKKDTYKGLKNRILGFIKRQIKLFQAYFIAN